MSYLDQQFDMEGQSRSDLDIVVLFTTTELTRAALRETEALTLGLNAHVRLIRVQIVPFPLDLNRSPVAPEFLSEQLAKIPCHLPFTAEVYLARELKPALIAALKPKTVTVLTSNRRPWRTSQERLAAGLKTAGYEVVIRYPERHTHPCA
ncbi:MAG: hypothetical protein NVSMB62_26140 [Acidobacteriaceae bacterium]